jgi:hypothetical protein
VGGHPRAIAARWITGVIFWPASYRRLIAVVGSAESLTPKPWIINGPTAIVFVNAARN